MSADTCRRLTEPSVAAFAASATRRSCIQSLANGFALANDLCPSCTRQFMAALDGIGGPLQWHRNFTERAQTGCDLMTAPDPIREAQQAVYQTELPGAIKRAVDRVLGEMVDDPGAWGREAVELPAEVLELASGSSRVQEPVVENLDDYDPHALNIIANAVVDLYGDVRLDIRYQAAAAGLRVVNEWQRSTPAPPSGSVTEAGGQ